ncbi:patched domain-containing protein 3-like [Anneissia japonica]|uniref:patched domain-containing protein 3-like n=1 Tax=Anneissia japonica TaxID=1529436 RepID=UPI001425B43F|nr:patched domain-containing protein 3-like [Anneissia japonica]
MDAASHIRRELNILSHCLSNSISNKPHLYILFPLILTGCLSFGAFFATFETDVDKLFTPLYSKAVHEQYQTELYFPTNYSEYFLNRGTKVIEKGCNIRITSSSGENLINDGILMEVLKLDDFIRNSIVNDEFGFVDVCAKWNGTCVLNPLVEVYYGNNSFVPNSNLTYPFTLRSDGVQYFLGNSLGGVTVRSGTNYLESAREIILAYILKSDTVDDSTLSSMWEKQISAVLRNYESESINIVYYTSQTFSEQLYSTLKNTIPYIIISFFAIATFASMTCMRREWVLSKPFLAQCGLISAILACISAFGIVSFFQAKLNVVAICVVFLTIGIGLENTFILLSSWRETDPRLTTEDRLSRCYNDTAISIAITSFANVIIYMIGAINPFLCIRVPCLCAGFSILFTYVYQITFFGACLFYTGKQENENSHCCAHVKDKSPNAPYRCLCAGGVHLDREFTMYEIKPLISWLIQAYLAPFIIHPVSKYIIILIIVFYEVFAIYGCFNLPILVKENEATNNMSYSYTSDLEEYGPPVYVIMTEEQEYWRGDVQNNFEKITQSFESSVYSCGPEFTVSWLRAYCNFLISSIGSCNVTQAIFMDKLQNDFLKTSDGEQFKHDLVFSKSRDRKFINSRFLIMTKNAYTYSDDSKLMRDMRSIADSPTTKITVFSPFFIAIEQREDVISFTLELCLIATICMFILTLLFIPNPISSIWITFSVFSIETGVVGYMTFWGVNLDIFSMICIILSIGFSVDFSTHMTYAYVLSDAETSNQRALSALSTMGMPIVQIYFVVSGSSMFLLLSSSTIFINAFKTIFLLMTFGFFHAMFVLPVLLTILGPGTKKVVEPQRTEQYLLNKSTTIYEVSPLVSIV